MNSRFASQVLWFQQYCLSKFKTSTVKSMQSQIALYLLPKWGNKTRAQITPEKINEWLSDDSLSHLSPKSMKHCVTTLGMIIGKRFSREIRYPSIRREQEEAACFTPEQMRALIENATGVYKLLFAIASETGCRAGELYGLEITDVDFIRNQIHVRRSVYDGQVQSVKTNNSRRVIDVKPWLIQMIKEHIGDRKSGLIMMNSRAQAFRNTTVLRRHLHPALKHLRYPKCGMHAFRHGRVSFLVEIGAPREVIKRWIGHGSDQMIDRYMHLRPDYCAAALAKVPSMQPSFGTFSGSTLGNPLAEVA